MNDLRDRLLAAFRTEHREYLDGMRALLAELHRASGPPPDETLNELFRLAHSLKAAAKVCDFTTVEALGQRLETIFARLRKGALRLDDELKKLLNTLLNAMEDWGITLANQPSPAEPAAALEAADRYLAKPSAAKAKPSANDLGPRLLAAFQIEHKEHLEGIRTLLAKFGRDDGLSPEEVDEVFRRAHTLKGAARLAGIGPAETIAHRLETIFAQVRDGTLPLNLKAVQVIQRGLDAIEDGAACLIDRRPAPDPTPVLQAIERLMGTSPEAPSEAPPPAPKPAPSEAPPQATAPPSPSPPKAVTEAPSALATSIETVRIRADNLDQLLRSAGQLLSESLGQHRVGRELDHLGQQIDEMEKQWDTVRIAAAAPLRELASLPGYGRIARYLTLVEHQVHALSRQARAVRLVQQRSAGALHILSGQLQRDVRQARMVSAESVFQGFRKMMRDLATDVGKEIDFRVSGLEIEADRLVLQALKDPLMHVLCNAVSHGIETPDERRRQGKDAVGQVALQLEARGSHLHITVADDGSGLDFQKIGATAVARGFLSSAEAASAPPEELARLVFRPGFSTAGTVTGLSGRGMGLSVVYEAASRLQGDVEVAPAANSGTVLSIVVPLSISTQRILLVACRAQTFAIPVHAVEHVLRARLTEIETVEGRPMLLFKGQPVPLLSLAHLLGMPETEVSVEGDYFPIMILRAGAMRYAIAVDALIAEREGLIQDVDTPAAQVRQLAGALLMEDGAIVLVLNPAELVKDFRPTEHAPIVKAAAPPPENRLSTVLVVDDSLTTRTLEKSILEAHGYQVFIAMDGLEAMTQLRSEKIDLVISDVQMPRMDGFQLLEAMKRDRKFAQIPVIVVSSMESREYQERGLTLGADAYIVKQKFDHEELLAAIRQIL